MKYILSAILFSLRFRSNGRQFLPPVKGDDDNGDNDNGPVGNPESGAGSTALRIEVEDLIKNILPQIPYPPAMFKTVQPDRLNDYVLRFLYEKQTSKDIEALKGLITSMN